MDENVGKIYCLDRGNDDALAAAVFARLNGCGCNNGCGNGLGY